MSTIIPIQPKIINHAFTPEHPRQNYHGKKPVVLLILDGWGIGRDYDGNAITKANTPNIDAYWESFPHTQLLASGEMVGLPKDVDGNSETGHLNIGAGYIVHQELPRINTAIADGSFNENPAFHKAFSHVKKNNSTLHLMGLVGRGYVHSNLEHLYALLRLCKKENIIKVYIHAFTDGRDSPPNSGIHYLNQVLEKCKTLGVGQLATVMGRYLAMDRDKRWERIEKAYNSMTIGTGACTKDAIGFLKEEYKHNVTDEFMEPINVCNGDNSPRLIQDNDAVIFFNYRVDRPRELTRAFVMPNFEQGLKDEDYDPYYEKYHKTSLVKPSSMQTFHRQKILNNLCFVTMTTYEKNLPAEVAFPTIHVVNPLGKVLSEHGMKQLRITETEKERFVTYYLNGQKNIVYPGEHRIIFPSKGVKSYEDVPEMRAFEIKDELVKQINNNDFDIIIANIVNPDMIGHTGNLEAAIKSCEITDQITKNIVDAILAKDGLAIIVADHGNVEEIINSETGEPDTEHSSNPVPFILIGNEYKDKPHYLPTGILADIAPTILKLMGLPKPDSMTARELI